jgi:alpha-L-rhamnosidase
MNRLCPTVFLWVMVLLHGIRAAEETPRFAAARPIWPKGRETERNLLVEFRASFDGPLASPVVLRLAGSTLYRIFVNGRFAGHGPARAGHGFYRVDEWDITRYLQGGRNEVSIEVAGYNANSYYVLDQPSFLQAEVVAAGAVVAATGSDSFNARIRHDRVQKTQRYSFQRPFSEIWQLPGPAADLAECAIVAAKPLTPRRVPYPTFALRRPVAHIAAGEVMPAAPTRPLWRDRSLTAIGPKLGGFPETELASIPSLELQGWKTRATRPVSLATTFQLQANGFRTVDFGVNSSGFVGARVTARTRTRLFVTFDEILTDGEVDFTRLDCANVIAYDLAPGSYPLESFEPYTLRYLKFTVLEGDCEVTDCYLRELANPDAGRAQFTASDPRLNRIFEAARETFRQNATDIFMDCPSRERAGWLCDSFFTARVAQDLCGETVVEKNFFENFQRPERFAHLPDGMLPMCYPADHYDGVFIPNWALWFVVQLEEYARRSGDRELVNALRPRVLKLFAYLRQFENSDGLLEKLPGWIFIEWSKANSFVRDVSYPSNMLYAGALDAAARIYAVPELAQEAATVRKTVRAQSFDGEFFVDNAVRQDGKLVVTTNRTEVCQYFAFYFGIATPETDAALWRKLRESFGPQYKKTKAPVFPEVHPANAFVGDQLRFELLSRDGRGQQILDEAIDTWLYMVERTGTLWEHDDTKASCDHGFGSHAAHVLLRDVLGMREVDPIGRRVKVRFSEVKLEACSGSLPTRDGPIELSWKKTADKLVYRLVAPAGYTLEIENRTGRALVKE